MADSDIFQKILTKYWGYGSFRPLQEEVIKSISSGKDTLALMPTGGGKSVTFQVPALAVDGICLVISPLVALMKEQVARLVAMDIKALAVYSGMTREEVIVALDNCIYGDFKFLYVSPERIGTDLFKAKVQAMNISILAVDEAHCISQWGYDFRPSYLRIAELRELLAPETPVLALTASATPRVADDIMKRLLFKEPNELKTSFERKNISYLVRSTADKAGYLVKTISQARGSGIVYVKSRNRAKEVAEMLVSNKISADFYHAGLSHELRDKKQKEWSAGGTRVIVATNAFGMGIDKADVRFVIHWDIPDSLEAYFQESGRVGRDEKPASAVLLYSPSEKKKLLDSVRIRFPAPDRILDVYESLCNYFEIPVGSGKNSVYDFNLNEFISRFRLSIQETYNSLVFLQREGYLEFTEEINNPSRIHFKMARDDLYKFQVANASFDSFIKLLLRSYSGFFTQYVAVNEESLADKAGIKRDAVYQYLVRLSAQGVISYIPGKRCPLIIFTEQRLERKALHISADNYTRVKERYVTRLENVIEYAESTTKCRSVMLLDYFGESADRCGLCDVCKARNELDLSKYEFDLILEGIKAALGIGSMPPDEIVAKGRLPGREGGSRPQVPPRP